MTMTTGRRAGRRTRIKLGLLACAAASPLLLGAQAALADDDDASTVSELVVTATPIRDSIEKPTRDRSRPGRRSH